MLFLSRDRETVALTVFLRHATRTICAPPLVRNLTAQDEFGL